MSKDPSDPASPASVPLGPLNVATKGAAVYSEVRARILDGSLSPGLVINQATLAETLGVSVTPLREALRRLEGEGLVKVGGKSVSVVALTQRELAELRLVRLRLDPLAASLAAARATSRQRVQLSSMADIQLSSDLVKWHTVHGDFHRTIHQMADNTVLSEALAGLWERLDRYRLVVLSQDDIHRAAAGIPHTALADAIAAGDEEAAEHLMFRHLQTVLGAQDETMEHRIASGTDQRASSSN